MINLPSWLIIGVTTFLVAFIFNRIFPTNYRWFMGLKRPHWLTFEWAIPLIWTIIFICLSWSAYNIWESNPGSKNTWLLMICYLILEIVILAYTPLMCSVRSLTLGTIIGGLGFILGLILAILIYPLSFWGFALMLPYLLWSPIGTYVTFKMIKLNPGNA